jgi:phosphoribosylformylglycinamidine (FGAM) synthase-like enzyme
VVRVHETGGALAMTLDCNSRYVGLDPYLGAQHAVAEAVRNLAATGARAAAISDCLNFGNPEKPEIMWEFERAVEGMAAACEIFSTPVISGNVSFYNDNQGESIPPTPVVAMVGIIKDSTRVAQAGIRQNGLKLYVVGKGQPELEGSEFLWRKHHQRGLKPPAIDLVAESELADLLVDLVEYGMVDTAHDISDGGLAVALAEMCLTGSKIGCDVEIPLVERTDNTLFGEGGGRILVAVAASATDGFEDLAGRSGIPVTRIGTTGGDRLVVRTRDGLIDIDVKLSELDARREAALPEIAAGRRTVA